MSAANRPQLVAPTGQQKPKPPASVGELLSREDETLSRLKSIATKFLPPERALRLAIQAVRRTPELAQCSPTSFMGALMSATGLGLEPNTPLQLAHLIPYKMSQPKRDGNGDIVTGPGGKWVWEEYYECNFQVGYRGFVNLFYRSPLTSDVNGDAIYRGDHFRHRKGTETYLEFEKNLETERTELLGAFCFTKLRDGQSFTVLNRDDIHKIRAKSQTYTSLVMAVENAKNDKDRQKAQRKLDTTPWVEWESEMAMKSAIRRHAKLANLSVELALAADLDGLADAGAIDISMMADPDTAKTILDGEYELRGNDGRREAPEEGPANAPAGSQAADGAAGKSLEHKPEEPMPGLGAKREPAAVETGRADDGASEPDGRPAPPNLFGEE